MLLSDFDFSLPESLIARYPTEKRDASRLMRLDRATGAVAHHRFSELPQLLEPNDVLVVNNSRVLPARLLGKKATGGKVEILLVEPEGGHPSSDRHRYKAMLRGGSKLNVGDPIELPDTQLRVRARLDDGFFVVEGESDLQALAKRQGELPIPPYLGRDAEALDELRYQTVYAQALGSVAAPTAGLHFTEAVFQALEAKGVQRVELTLHVGPGTFLPVRSSSIDAHKMHAEWYELRAEAAETLRAAKAEGRRVIAVGTTCTRTLEAVGSELKAGWGTTEIFIKPGHEFQVVDGLITNFHLPRSTLLMLVSALAGHEAILAAYRTAVEQGYRFYSYGDAQLIL